jgi:hypothetical protein
MAWTLITSLSSPTAGAFTFSPLDLTGYDVAMIVMSGIKVTTDGTDIYLTFYVGGSEVVTGYRWGSSAVSSSASNLDGVDSSDPRINLTNISANWDVGNAAAESFGGIVRVDQPVSTSLHKRVGGEVVMVGPTSNTIYHHTHGLMENTGAINGIKIAGSSALTAGSVIILGL